MLKNYLTITLRTLSRDKSYTMINLLGLAFGIACSLLILLYVRSEWSHDAFHEHAEALYRVNADWQSDGALERWADTPVPLAPALAETFPEIERATRVYRSFTTVRQEEATAYAFMAFVDADFFRMFSFPFVAGSPEAAFPNPGSVVVAQGFAERQFGSADPLGQVLLIKMRGGFEPFTVTGVLADPPENSSIVYELLVPIGRVEESEYGAGLLSNWGSQGGTFVQLRPTATAAELERKLPSFVAKYAASLPTQRQAMAFSLQPLEEIYFDGTRNTLGITRTSDVAYSYILLGVALLILFIACVNFMTLAVAQSARRLKEVGVRKVLGADRFGLARQFLGEALVMTFFALILGLALAELFLPTFNGLVGRSLSIDYAARPSTVLLLLGLMLGVCIGAGSYPALYLSGLRPAFILQDRVAVKGRNALMRMLVLLQFTLSVSLLVGTLVMSRQLAFMAQYDLGMDPGDVVVVEPDFTSGQTHGRLYALLQARQGGEVGMRQLARSSGMIGRSYSTLQLQNGNDVVEAYRWAVTPSYLATMGLSLREGTAFGEGATQEVLINEAMVAAMGWAEGTVVGRTLSDQSVVVGVVEDFHFHSLRSRIRPLVLQPMPVDMAGGYLSVRVDPARRVEALALLRATWVEVAPDVPFQYFFLEDDLRASYEGEAMWRQVFGYAAGFAILIACLGLFGLSALTVTRRTQEIGIRKVMGASAVDVVLLIAKGFVLLVAIATLLAAPISYAVMSRWLDDFAFRIDLGPGVFLLVGGGVLALALLTVSFQAVRAALSDPVDALRYE